MSSSLLTKPIPPARGLSKNLNQLGRYLDQPTIIREAGLYGALPVGAIGMGLITAKDIKNAKPENKKEIAVRDALVLGTTAAGTMLAAKKFMPIVPLSECKEFASNFKTEITQLIKEHPSLGEALQKNEHTRMALATNPDNPAPFTQKALQEIDRLVKNHLPGSLAQKEETIAKLFGEEEQSPSEELKEEIDKAYDFFATGGMSVLSGMTGGWLANKVNQKQDPKTNENMVKEGAFQFVANIALCAVGAIGGLMVAAIPKVHEFTKASLAGRLTKVGIVTSGLSVGIFGGGFAANALGKKVINPFFKWLDNPEQSQSEKMTQLASYGTLATAGAAAGGLGLTALPGLKHMVNYNSVSKKLAKTVLGGAGAVAGAKLPSLLRQKGVQPFSSWPEMIDKSHGSDTENRKLEPADVILHVDDIPTAAALAGLEVVEPFIPAFFGFSGYRAGIGYRNDHSQPVQKSTIDETPAFSTPARNPNAPLSPSTFASYTPYTGASPYQGFSVPASTAASRQNLSNTPNPFLQPTRSSVYT